MNVCSTSNVHHLIADGWLGVTAVLVAGIGGTSSRRESVGSISDKSRVVRSVSDKSRVIVLLRPIPVLGASIQSSR